jgi:signal recognition particle subunit SRP54
MMGLVEKISRIQSEIKEEDLKKQQEKLEKGSFGIEDFRNQFEMLAKMGGMRDLIDKMPGMSELIPKGEDPEDALKRVQGMIDSMTKKEKRDPDLIDASRRKRIAAGAGVEPHEVKQFLAQFDQARQLMKQMASMSIWQRMKMMSGLGKMGAFGPGAPQLKVKGDTGKRKTAKERAEERKKKKKKRK